MTDEVTTLPSGALVFVDADTGDEMLYFTRRLRRRVDTIRLVTPIPYLYLRDKDTKRFIKRLRSMEFRFFAVVDYDKEEAKKGNPLYLDAVVKTLLTCTTTRYRAEVEGRQVWKTRIEDDVGEWERARDRLGYACDAVVKQFFGDYVMRLLLEDAGIEFGSEPSVTETKAQGKCHYVLVWKHHKEDKPRSQEGTTSL